MIDLDKMMKRREELKPFYHSGPFYEIEHREFEPGAVIVSSGPESLGYEIAQIDHRGKRRVKARSNTKQLALDIGSLLLWKSEK